MYPNRRKTILQKHISDPAYGDGAWVDAQQRHSMSNFILFRVQRVKDQITNVYASIVVVVFFFLLLRVQGVKGQITSLYASFVVIVLYCSGFKGLKAK